MALGSTVAKEEDDDEEDKEGGGMGWIKGRETTGLALLLSSSDAAWNINDLCWARPSETGCWNVTDIL